MDHGRAPSKVHSRGSVAALAVCAGLLLVVTAAASRAPANRAPANRAPTSRAPTVRYRGVSDPAHIYAVGAENFYADVIAQLGGARVRVATIISNPATDPHTYESSTADASAVARAGLVVQNGLGYDSFMQKLATASPNSRRTVLDVGALLGYRTGDNPHLWYNPATMPRVAAAVAAALARLDPADRAVFAANLRRFDASLEAWTGEIGRLRERFRGAPVAVTEPVFNYAAAAVGLHVLTPLSFQLAIEEGNDPAPQDVQAEQNLLQQRKVRVLLYNVQAVEPLTVQLLGLAHANHIPVVGVYETMPPGLTYQGWMMAEMGALDRALGHGISTERLP